MNYKFYLFSDPLDFEDDIVTCKSRIEDFFWPLSPTVTYSFEATDIGRDLETKDYDILLFDWGGLSFGNSMLEHFTFRIINIAENNPSKKIVVISDMTTSAFNDAKEQLGKDLPFNIYFGWDELFASLEKETNEWLKNHQNT